MSDNVTLSGGASQSIVAHTVTLDSAVNAQIAQQLLASASSAVAGGTDGVYSTSPGTDFLKSAGFDIGFTPITHPATISGPGTGNVLFIANKYTASTVHITDPNTGVVFDYSTKADTVYGGSASSQILVTGNYGGTYFTNTGSGTVVAGGGNNVIVSNSTNGGGHRIIVGGGNDTIVSHTGNDTIDAGVAANVPGQPGLGTATISLLAGHDVVNVLGTDSIFVGTGSVGGGSCGAGASDTANVSVAVNVSAGGSAYVQLGAGADTVSLDVSAGGSALVQAGIGNLLLINQGGPATVMGGLGSETICAGTGGGLYYGGDAGNNVLHAGNGGSTTLVGGGNNDTLVADGGTNVLAAGGDNNLLVGGLSGSSTLYGLGNNDTLVARDSSTVLNAGSGSETLVGFSGGGNTFAFDAAQTGGNVLVSDFTVGTDTLSLAGYGYSDAQVQAMLNAAQAHPTGGSEHISLSDGTTITFDGVTGPIKFTNSP